MKKYFSLAIVASLILVASCKKDEFNPHSYSSAAGYSSLKDFLSANGPKMQYYLVDAAEGAVLTSPQGTTIQIPANAFTTQSMQPVTGTVTIMFKDIYNKSDMLLADMPTQMSNGAPVKSGGEFFIKAVQNNQALLLAPNQQINIAQPIIGVPDSAMQALVDTGNAGWVQAANNVVSINNSAFSYIYNMYQFSTPCDSGSWCNSDNTTFFSAYPQTHLNLVPSDVLTGAGYSTFLVFSNINSMVHVYEGQNGNFPYNYAPVGLSCTVVFVMVKDDKLRASFTPITITNSMNVQLNATQEMTSRDFKTQLNALN
ncbi:MAG TPA: hypothetical protein VL651_05745 [Bacteroidia bacterium]|jgi:hypothetical protein|nr:hypothetical protein [Bacteroidia bacterium]